MSLIINELTAGIARTVNRMGLAPVNHAAKRVVRGVTRNQLEVGWSGMRFAGTADSWTILNQIRSGKLEAFERDLFIRCLSPGMKVLDIGANIGFYSVLASRAVAPTGSVYAFEPDPRTRQALVLNLRRNGAQNVDVFDTAVSSCSGTATMFMSSTATQSGLHRSMEDSQPEAIRVQTVAIDDLGLGQVDVVKIDIEGEEPAALEGMKETLAASPGLRVFLEFNPLALAAAEQDANAFAAYLCRQFKDVLVIDEKARILTPFDAASVADRRLNLLCNSATGLPSGVTR